MSGKALQEKGGQIITVMIIKVHGQKGHIRRHVNQSKALIEFNTVVNIDMIIDKTDMLHMQITMTFLDHAGRHPPGKKIFMTTDKLFAERHNPLIINH